MCTVCTAIFFHFFCKINDFSVPPETVELIWIYTNDQPLRTISLDIWTSRINPLCVFKETLLNPARHSQRLEWNAPHACWLDLFSCDRNPFSWINLLILKPLNYSLPFRPLLKNDQTIVHFYHCAVRMMKYCFALQQGKLVDRKTEYCTNRAARISFLSDAFSCKQSKLKITGLTVSFFARRKHTDPFLNSCRSLCSCSGLR